MNININRGIFLTIEGVDGCGKSTQSVLLTRWLEDFTGHETIKTFEPGGWHGGSFLRNFILQEDFSPKGELFLFLADRAEHLSQIIIPALNSGKNIICERYNDSTEAYQAGGHDLDRDQVKKIISACNFPEPDITILLSISPKVASNRLQIRPGHDRFEAEGLEFMQKISDSYLKIAQENKERIININVDELSIIDTFNKITSEIRSRWPSR